MLFSKGCYERINFVFTAWPNYRHCQFVDILGEHLPQVAFDFLGYLMCYSVDLRIPKNLVEEIWTKTKHCNMP